MDMRSKFSWYGFLKNQKFFEPFIILYFLSTGLNFFQISILISFKEILTNIFEVPSGVFADLFGKRLSMIFSFIAYIISFFIFSFSFEYIFFFIAFFFFAIGEAFRTGTHKAIIFDYLESNNKGDLKVRFYGYTRSWSKIGSAVSVIIGVIIMLFLREYKYVFLLSIIPYALNVVNFLGYPVDVRTISKRTGIDLIITTLKDSFKDILKIRALRLLFLKSMTYEGVFTISKDYIQPIIKSFAFLLPLFMTMNLDQRSSILIGIVYFFIYIFGSIASRNAFRFVKGAKSKTLGHLMLISVVIYIGISVFLKVEIFPLVILLFFIIHFLQNIFRPVLISEVGDHMDFAKSSTLLSIESQSKSFFVFLLAPLFGFLVDTFGIFIIGFLSAGFLTLGWLIERLFTQQSS